jgi:mono/diheme cytochrome c family protein
VTIISREVFCGLLLLFAVSTSRADESVSLPGSHGEYLARAGDCVACHSVPGGKAFAGGLKMGSPLGAIYSTNITPDPETGIGTYSLEDFDRAVRRGIAKDGQRLYPAMPYPSYAKLTDADVAALYDFFMKQVPPVHQENSQNEIPPLLSFRACDLESCFHHERQLCRQKRPRCRVESRRLSGARAWPLRRLPHPARLRLAGKGARRQQLELPLRSIAGRMVRAGLARRRSHRSRHLVERRPCRFSQARSQPRRDGVRLDD